MSRGRPSLHRRPANASAPRHRWRNRRCRVRRSRKGSVKRSQPSLRRRPGNVSGSNPRSRSPRRHLSSPRFRPSHAPWNNRRGSGFRQNRAGWRRLFTHPRRRLRRPHSRSAPSCLASRPTGCIACRKGRMKTTTSGARTTAARVCACRRPARSVRATQGAGGEGGDSLLLSDCGAIQANSEERIASSTVMPIGSTQPRGTNTV